MSKKIQIYIFAVALILLFAPGIAIAGSCKCMQYPTTATPAKESCIKDIADSGACNGYLNKEAPDGGICNEVSYFDDDNCGVAAGTGEVEYQTFEGAIEPRLSVPDFDVKFSDIVVETDETGRRYINVPYLAEYIAAIYRYMVGVATLLAVVMIMYGGFRWITAAGDAGKIGQAKNTITGAVIGLIIALGSYTILLLINPDLVSFGALRLEVVEQESFVYDYLPAFPEIEWAEDYELGTGCRPYPPVHIKNDDRSGDAALGASVKIYAEKTVNYKDPVDGTTRQITWVDTCPAGEREKRIPEKYLSNKTGLAPLQHVWPKEMVFGALQAEKDFGFNAGWLLAQAAHEQGKDYPKTLDSPKTKSPPLRAWGRRCAYPVQFAYPVDNSQMCGDETMVAKYHNKPTDLTFAELKSKCENFDIQGFASKNPGKGFEGIEQCYVHQSGVRCKGSGSWQAYTCEAKVGSFHDAAYYQAQWYINILLGQYCKGCGDWQDYNNNAIVFTERMSCTISAGARGTQWDNCLLSIIYQNCLEGTTDPDYLEFLNETTYGWAGCAPSKDKKKPHDKGADPYDIGRWEEIVGPISLPEEIREQL